MIAARVVSAIIVADMRRELRRPLGLVGMLLFGACSLVVMHLALAGGTQPAPGVAAGTLWIVLVYGALLSTGRGLAAEQEQGTLDALLLAAADRSAVFLGKAISAWVHTLLLHTLLVPLYLLLFRAPQHTAALAVLVLAVVLADLGFAFSAVLVAAVALRAHSRELLAAAMLLPLTVPLLVAAVTATLWAYGGAPSASPTQLLSFLTLYAGTFVAIGVAAFPEVAVE